MRVLVTGHAGFIGYHTARRLLERGDTVIGVDSVNDYYEVSLKEARLASLEAVARESGAEYRSVRADLARREALDSLFSQHAFDRVIHMAAQAGVRYSLVNPHAYVESNIIAFLNVLEACRHHTVAHLTYASTSSVYGSNRTLPFRESQGADHPLQFYAATKRANELMAHSYSHLFGLPTTGLRFFTVYGPWGRPDMAPFIFLRAILAGTPIELFNSGHHTRDFTYVDDIVEGVIRASDDPAVADPSWDALVPDPGSSNAPFRIFNIGNSDPVPVTEFLNALEEALGRRAEIVLRPLQPGDVADTRADVGRLERAVGYRPSTSVRDGVRRLVDWYREFFREPG